MISQLTNITRTTFTLILIGSNQQWLFHREFQKLPALSEELASE